MYGCESWTIKKAECSRIDTWHWIEIMLLKKTLESPLDSKEIKPVNRRGDQPWVFIGKTDAEAEAPVFWSPDANNRLTGKVLSAGKDWGQKEKRASEDEIAGCHHQCNGHELGHSLGDGDGQGGLMCCSPWGHKELNTTRQLNNSLSEHTAV